MHDLLYPDVSYVAPHPHGTARVSVSTALAGADLAYTKGELDKAAFLGKQALAQAQRLQQGSYSPVAHLLLASISFRRRDVKAASAYAKLVSEDALLGRCVWLTGQRAWLYMQIREAESGAEEAAPLIRELIDLGEVSREVLSANPAAAAWLVRLSLKVNDGAMARQGVSAAWELASMNPEVESLVAAAVHAEGLLDEDLNALWKAAETHQDPWARASALEDIGKRMVCEKLHRERAIEVLELSGDSYLAVGASRDVSRIKSTLRGLEVRHSVSRWSDRREREIGDLTRTEFEVAQLTAHGLTNSQVAAQLFLSHHTVAFHLRKIFPKLGVTSRVELARTWNAKFDGG
ncbi:LuxR C-terminal-related transcriptional regulator [Streptomyces sp. NPDC002588]|uniref:helix-turn-helix transcriptional regulator n=1 Tax=Streptomyces sp. NPDC002588 TaxID=3154419 RepID=UPI00331A02D2